VWQAHGPSTTQRTCSSRWATCSTSRSPRSGSGTPSNVTTSPSTWAPASTPPGEVVDMRRITNLHWPIEPFGSTQRPFAPDRPMMAAVTVGLTGYVRRPEWACAVYLYTDSTRTLSLDGQILNFGFEMLTTEPDDLPTALLERVDEILVA